LKFYFHLFLAFSLFFPPSSLFSSPYCIFSSSSPINYLINNLNREREEKGEKATRGRKREAMIIGF
jgi:hypothetical protein